MVSRLFAASVLAVCSLSVSSRAEAASLRGWVLLDGQPTPGAAVKATNSQGQVVYGSAGPNGWYQLTVGVGTWWVEGSHQSFLGGVDHPLEVVAPQDIVIGDVLLTD